MASLLTMSESVLKVGATKHLPTGALNRRLGLCCIGKSPGLIDFVSIPWEFSDFSPSFSLLLKHPLQIVFLPRGTVSLLSCLVGDMFTVAPHLLVDRERKRVCFVPQRLNIEGLLSFS